MRVQLILAGRMKKVFLIRYIALLFVYPLALLLIVYSSFLGAMGGFGYAFYWLPNMLTGYLLFFLLGLLPPPRFHHHKILYSKVYSSILWIVFAQEIIVVVIFCTSIYDPNTRNAILWLYEFPVLPIINAVLVSYAVYAQDTYRTKMRQAAEKMAQGSSK